MKGLAAGAGAVKGATGSTGTARSFREIAQTYNTNQLSRFVTAKQLVRQRYICRCVQNRKFSAGHAFLKQHHQATAQGADGAVSLDKAVRQKKSRSPAGKNSLLRVAVEAERSRDGFIRGKGSRRYVDPDAGTKTVSAYCAAEQYNIATVARLLQADGFVLDPFHTSLYPQVVHVRIPSPFETIDGEQEKDFGDVFIFPSGTLVTWGLKERVGLDLVNKTLKPASVSAHLELMEMEDLEYLEDSSKEDSSIVGDTIILGTKTRENESESEHITKSTARDGNSVQRHEIDTILAKIAFSSGLARSTKLAVLESLLSNYFNSTREIPIKLSRGAKLPYSRSFILQKTGELLSVRAQLNLYSEITDSLPDLFWDSRHELGLEGYYDQVGRALDVGQRIKALNDKMDYAQEIASVLRERLSEKRGQELEIIIIILILIEVIFEFMRKWKERQERRDPNSTESLLRQYLRTALKDKAPRTEPTS